MFLTLEIVNVKMEKETKQKIERLVNSKKYKNKSDALRKIVEQHFEEHPELFSSGEVEQSENEADEMSEREFEQLAFEVFAGSKKTAAELISEERERS